MERKVRRRDGHKLRWLGLEDIRGISLVNDNKQENPACYSKESLHVAEVKHYHTGWNPLIL
jgi:hypothetical protein